MRKIVEIKRNLMVKTRKMIANGVERSIVLQSGRNGGKNKNRRRNKKLPFLLNGTVASWIGILLVKIPIRNLTLLLKIAQTIRRTRSQLALVELGVVGTT